MRVLFGMNEKVADKQLLLFSSEENWDGYGTECMRFGRLDTRTPGNSELDGRGRVLHMGGGGHGNDEGSGKAGFVKEPGIAQSVHWFRDRDAGLTEGLMASLIGSELQVKLNILPLHFEASIQGDTEE